MNSAVLGVTGEEGSDFEAVLFTSSCLDSRPQHPLRLLVVVVQFETEGAHPRVFVVDWVECPTGEAARDFTHVLLGIAAVGAHGVQFHEFAGVVFVGVTSNVGIVGQILEHRATVGAC